MICVFTYKVVTNFADLRLWNFYLHCPSLNNITMFHFFVKFLNNHCQLSDYLTWLVLWTPSIIHYILVTNEHLHCNPWPWEPCSAWFINRYIEKSWDFRKEDQDNWNFSKIVKDGRFTRSETNKINNWWHQFVSQLLYLVRRYHHGKKCS